MMTRKIAIQIIHRIIGCLYCAMGEGNFRCVALAALGALCRLYAPPCVSSCVRRPFSAPCKIGSVTLDILLFIKTTEKIERARANEFYYFVVTTPTFDDESKRVATDPYCYPVTFCSELSLHLSAHPFHTAKTLGTCSPDRNWNLHNSVSMFQHL